MSRPWFCCPHLKHLPVQTCFVPGFRGMIVSSESWGFGPFRMAQVLASSIHAAIPVVVLGCCAFASMPFRRISFLSLFRGIHVRRCPVPALLRPPLALFWYRMGAGVGEVGRSSRVAAIVLASFVRGVSGTTLVSFLLSISCSASSFSFPQDISLIDFVNFSQSSASSSMRLFSAYSKFCQTVLISESVR